MVSIQKDTVQAIPVTDLTPDALADCRDVDSAALAGKDNQIGSYDIGKGQTLLTADYPETESPGAPQARASLVLLPKAGSPESDLAAVNALRRQAGLPALAHDT